MAPTPRDIFSLAGTRLADRFVIDAVVAGGGFGVVYRAHQHPLNRPVAVKVLRIPEDLSTKTRDALLEGFRREAELVAQLAHPSIVQVIDLAVTEMPNGVVAPWMALEWLDGTALDDWMNARRGDGGLSPREALDLMRPAFEALRAAHACGVAHRDIKPANLMLVKFPDGTTRLKVLDFGIARVMQPDEIAGSGHTATQSSFNPYSPLWAAPEQVLRARTGPWTDVHALALMMTELICARRAYGSGDITSIGTATLSPTRPNAGSFGIDVGPWEDILRRALALRPDERFPDAGALLHALETTVDAAMVPPVTHVRTVPVPTPMVPPETLAPATITAPPAPRWTLRTHGVLALVGVVVMVLVTALGVKLGRRSRAMERAAAPVTRIATDPIVPRPTETPAVPVAAPSVAPSPADNAAAVVVGQPVAPAIPHDTPEVSDDAPRHHGHRHHGDTPTSSSHASSSHASSSHASTASSSASPGTTTGAPAATTTPATTSATTHVRTDDPNAHFPTE